MQRRHLFMARLALLSLVLGASAYRGPLAAQSGVPASTVQAFLGEWSLELQGPGGPSLMTFDIEEMAGQTVVRFVGDEQLMVEVSKPSEELLLEWSQDLQGTTLRMVLALVPSGDQLIGELDAGGMFTANGLAMRR